MTRRDKLYVAGVGAVVLFSVAAMWFAWTLPGPLPESDEAESMESEGTAGSLSGVVVDVAGDPVVGALVRAGEREARSDDDGAFAFEGLPAGTWRVDARADGMLSPGPEAKRGVDFTLGGDDGPDSLDDVRLVLRWPGSVAGRVVAGKEGVGGAELSAHWLFAEGLGGRMEPFDLSALGRTQADGSFELKGLAPGRMKIVVRTARGGRVSSKEVDLVDRGEVKGVIIDLRPTGRIAGRVAAAGGGALVAEVEVSGGTLKRPLRTRSDAQGRYQIEGVPAGRVDISARAQGRRPSGRSVRVPAGRMVQVDFELRMATGITGRVVDQDNKPVRRAAVILRSGRVEKVLPTDFGGGFQIDPTTVDLAQATVHAVTPKHAPSAEVRVRPGQELVLKVRAGGYFSGMVVDPSGKPVGGAAVSIERFENNGTNPFRRFRERPSRTRADGAFQLGPLRPGRYDLRADHSHHAAGFVRSLALNSGDRHAGLRIVVGGGATVQGRVTSEAEGQPIGGVAVVLHEPGSTLPPKRTRTDAKGRYRITGLSAGKRTLRFQHNKYLTELSSGLSVPDQGYVERDVALRRRKPGERFSFQGIGATLGQGSKGIFIRNTMPGSPAERFGLKHGDVIVGVDFQPTTSMSLSRVVELIRGEAGQPVTIDIDRPGSGRMNIAVERGQVTVKSKPKPKGHP